MRQYLQYLKNPFIAGGFASTVVVLFAIIDTWTNDREFEKNYYIKLFCTVFLIVVFLVWFVKGSGVSQATIGGNRGASLPSFGGGGYSGGGYNGNGGGNGGGYSRKFDTHDVYTGLNDF